MGNGSSLWDHRNPRHKRQNIKNGVAFRSKTLLHQTIHPWWHQSLPYNFRGRTLHISRQQILLPGINHQPRSQGIRRRWQPYKKGLTSLRSPTKRCLHIQINILQCKKGCLHSPNFIRPSTWSRSMEPDGNRNEPSKMLPCTMRPRNVQNQSIPMWKNRISTCQLLNDLKMKPIEAYIDQRQMRWAGHVSRMPWNRLPRKILTAWCNSKNPRGAPQMTYGWNLKKVFKRRSVDHKTWMVRSKNAVFWSEKIRSFG